METYCFKMSIKKKNNKTEVYVKIHSTTPTDVFTFFKYLVKPLKTRHPARANCTKRKIKSPSILITTLKPADKAKPHNPQH